MVVREVKPITSGTAHPPKGRLTWVALAAIALFVVMLFAVVLRPLIARNDGPETGPPQVNVPATSPVAPS